MTRVLVSIACVAIIVFVGFFLWQQLQLHQQDQAAQDYATHRAFCLEAAKRFAANILDHADKDRCRADGYITPAEIEAITDGTTR